ncbi:hypothetical protein F4778DRAFT_473233 [Xylariomycetidae sp. FL2044]|nr:hypothetical protein F4778DRAFT_473233 [Xylariomycetidae sp. FL2044]
MDGSKPSRMGPSEYSLGRIPRQKTSMGPIVRHIASTYISEVDSGDVWSEPTDLDDDDDDDDLDSLYAEIAQYKGKTVVEEMKAGVRKKRPTDDLKGTIETSRPITTATTAAQDVGDDDDDDDDDDESREEELVQALQEAHANLTRMSQFMLKLETRTGKASNEGIRQTLDATTHDRDLHSTSPLEDDIDARDVIQDIRHLSATVARRMQIIDRSWRSSYSSSSSRRGDNNDNNKKNNGGGGERQREDGVSLMGEAGVRTWWEVEIRDVGFAGDDTRFYTVRDLADGRSLAHWAAYLRQLCGLTRSGPDDEAKLVELCWLFLDRELRGPRPRPRRRSHRQQQGKKSKTMPRIDEFILDLEARRDRGEFGRALADPKRQEREDAVAWRLIRKTWFPKGRS